MPNYFADAAVQQTTGGRGKTTRRKSTRTVRGCDGAYCAMVKEEMARREASIRQKKEAELRKYQKELDRLQAEAKKRKQAADAASSEGEDPPPR